MSYKLLTHIPPPPPHRFKYWEHKNSFGKVDRHGVKLDLGSEHMLIFEGPRKQQDTTMLAPVTPLRGAAYSNNGSAPNTPCNENDTHGSNAPQPLSREELLNHFAGKKILGNTNITANGTQLSTGTTPTLVRQNSMSMQHVAASSTPSMDSLQLQPLEAQPFFDSSLQPPSKPVEEVPIQPQMPGSNEPQPIPIGMTPTQGVTTTTTNQAVSSSVPQTNQTVSSKRKVEHLGLAQTKSKPVKQRKVRASTSSTGKAPYTRRSTRNNTKD